MYRIGSQSQSRFTMTIRTLPLILTACAILASASFAQEQHKMLDTAFPVEGKASLKMQIRDGDVQVISGEKNEFRVQVFVAAKKEKRAQEHFDTQRWDVSQRDGIVSIVTRKAYSRGLRSLLSRNEPEIRIVVRTPRSVDVDLRSYDGDIALENVDGNLKLHTSDGDIAVENVDGNLKLHTSDGDIAGQGLSGTTLNARTYDGNITVEKARFNNMVAHTSDGNVALAATTAEGVDVRTYDGDISCDGVKGSLRLITSDGDITGQGLSGTALNARTYDGDITVETTKFKDLIARTSDGNISLGDVTAGKVELRTYEGDIAFDDVNGDLQGTTSDGNIKASGLSGSRFEAVTYEGSIDVESANSLNLVARSSEGHILVDSLASQTSSITASDGTIFVDLAILGNVKLRASDGDIIVEMPTERAASLDLRGNSIQLDCCPAPAFEGRWEKRRVEGRLNGGGALLQATAHDGAVRLLGQ